MLDILSTNQAININVDHINYCKVLQNRNFLGKVGVGEGIKGV